MLAGERVAFGLLGDANEHGLDESEVGIQLASGMPQGSSRRQVAPL